MKIAKQLVAGAGILAVFMIGAVLLAWPLERFLEDPARSNWPAALQVSSTVLVVLVTFAYVVFTARLVRVEEDPRSKIRLAAREEAARQILSVLFAEGWRVRDLQDQFPLDAEAALASRIPYSSKEYDSLGDRLLEIHPLLPAEVRNPAQAALACYAEMMVAITALRGSLQQERALAEQEEREPDEEKAKARFYLEWRSEPHQHEWSDLISGTYVDKAVDSWNQLQSAMTAYLSD